MNTAKGAREIRNFIYLDEDKMYSLSSQLFEGVTEYVLNESSSGKELSEGQRGPIGSGKVLGDILRSSERKTEKKFLNDYSFTIFEKRLVDEDRVSFIPQELNSEPLQEYKSFIKVTSAATFNDINSVIATLKNFNAVGRALARVTNANGVNSDPVNSASDVVNAAIVRSARQSNKSAKPLNRKNHDHLASQLGLQQDQKFLDDLCLLLGFGFQDQFEVQMHQGGQVYSANLNRAFLREAEELVIRKYSRRTEVEFTLFGIVTQRERNGPLDVEELSENSSIKLALMNLVSSLSNVEGTFTGRLDNEVIIDPIALYTKL